MKILIVPLNWGLGHAARCIPLIRKYAADGCEVVLGGDGDSLTLLRKQFPELRSVEFPALKLTYSESNTQVGAMIRMLPRLIIGSLRDHYALKRLLATESFDRVISDNRFGLYTSLRQKSRWLPRRKRVQPQPAEKRKEPETIYITHQVMIKLPIGLRWMEPMVAAIHRNIITRYTQCWIPDYAGENNLSGDLSHKYELPRNAKFIGPLSRFPAAKSHSLYGDKLQTYPAVAVLSGLEPQRTLLEEQLMQEYAGREERLLVVRGLMDQPNTLITHKNITLVPYLNDSDLQDALLATRTIIARSGYSTLMDLAALGCIDKARLIPTPGQTEQEYLARHLQQNSSPEKDS
ncbi:MAG: hypothetical protein IJV55_00680 [Paludibacteraceae bacterium]|nr:hypothetical protein [Paludibacteraceae bacterium]